MLTAAERETRFSMMGEGKWYKLTAGQVTIKAPAKPPTEAQIKARQKAVELMNSR